MVSGVKRGVRWGRGPNESDFGVDILCGDPKGLRKKKRTISDSEESDSEDSDSEDSVDEDSEEESEEEGEEEEEEEEEEKGERKRRRKSQPECQVMFCTLM